MIKLIDSPILVQFLSKESPIIKLNFIITTNNNIRFHYGNAFRERIFYLRSYLIN